LRWYNIGKEQEKKMKILGIGTKFEFLRAGEVHTVEKIIKVSDRPGHAAYFVVTDLDVFPIDELTHFFG
jgi:hypothetical protein